MTQDLNNNRREIYRGGLIELGLETVKLPNDEIVALEIVRHPGGSVIVALNDQQEVCLLKQYRYAAGGWIWELPAGTVDEGEETLTTAKRELAEEAGISAGSWESLGEMLASPGFCTEKLYLFLARDLTQMASEHEPHEVIEIHWLPFPQAFSMAQIGEINDAKTITALFRANAIIHG